jgi:hypothetical protein
MAALPSRRAAVGMTATVAPPAPRSTKPPATLKVAAVTGSKGAGAGEGLTQDIRRERERTRPRTCAN